MENNKGKITVLHVLRSSCFSGAENIAITIIKYMNEYYRCVYTSVNGSIAEKLKENNIEYYPLKEFSILELKRVIYRLNPSIIHAHDYTASIICSMLKGKAKLISHLHHESGGNWRKFCYRCFFSRMDRVVLVSEALLTGIPICHDNKITILNNPIDSDRIQMMARQETEQSKEYDLIYLGRLNSIKGCVRFINIVYELKRLGFHVKAVMLGEGEQYKKCQNLIKYYQISVDMLGFVENPYSILKKSKILIMTSKNEGFGLAVMEANVLGVPALVTPVGYMLNYFGEGAEELCYTDQEFCEKIIQLLRDPDLYNQYKEKTFYRTRKLENLYHYTHKIKRIYEEYSGNN